MQSPQQFEDVQLEQGGLVVLGAGVPVVVPPVHGKHETTVLHGPMLVQMGGGGL
jgi:hypothetical protein